MAFVFRDKAPLSFVKRETDLLARARAFFFGLEQLLEGVVLAVDKGIVIREGPFRKDDWLVGVPLLSVHAGEGEGVPADDIAGENEARGAAGFFVTVLAAGGAVCYDVSR